MCMTAEHSTLLPHPHTEKIKACSPWYKLYYQMLWGFNDSASKATDHVSQKQLVALSCIPAYVRQARVCCELITPLRIIWGTDMMTINLRTVSYTHLTLPTTAEV